MTFCSFQPSAKDLQRQKTILTSYFRIWQPTAFFESWHIYKLGFISQASLSHSLMMLFLLKDTDCKKTFFSDIAGKKQPTKKVTEADIDSKLFQKM